MLGNAGKTQYDLRFRLFGIPVRVHPLFWLISALVTWVPNRLDLVLVGIACFFLSVLIHELGHALMFRQYGFRSEIVLYMLGGYATGSRLSTWRSVMVSAAGPAAGFLLAAVAMGSRVAFAPTVLDGNPVLEFALGSLIFFNICLGVFNLVPCVPLDGGQIMQALVHRYSPRRAATKVHWISILSSGAVAFWGLQNGLQFLMIFFGIFCVQHVMALNQQGRFR
jgi:stage IV sporulation protein FB